jgi:SprT protein
MKNTAEKKPLCLVTPIGDVERREVMEQTAHFIRLGGELLGRHFDMIPVHFDLKGRTAGMYKVLGRGRRAQRQIRYNPWIFAKYYENNLNVTVPHEVAHYLVDCTYNSKWKGSRRVRPHGVEWKSMMDAFGVDSRVTSTFDLEGIPQRQIQQFLYRCGCKDHHLSIRRHNKVYRQEATYLCRGCGEVLQSVEVGSTGDGL